MSAARVVLMGLLLTCAVTACGASDKETALPPTATTHPPGAGPTAPQSLAFTGAVAGTMTQGHHGPQTSDTVCTDHTWNIVGTVGGTDYKLTMQDTDGMVQLSQVVGPGGRSTPQLYRARSAKTSFSVNSDKRSGTVDVELKPLEGDGNVHVKGAWACVATA